MKVLIVSTVRFRLNGVTSVILNYYRNMDKADMQIDFVVHNEISDEYRQELESNGSRVFRLPRKKNPLVYMWKLYRLLKKGSYDIIHIHGNSAMMTIDVLPAVLAGTPVRIVHCHSTSCSHMKAHKLLLPLFSKCYTHGFACGEAAGRWLFGSKPFQIIKNGIELKRYCYDPALRQTSREKLGAEDQTVIGHIGNFSSEKNHTFLIDAFSTLLKRDRSYLLALIGDGILMDDIRAKAAESGIEKDVVFIGKTTQVPEYLQAMDMLVLPSRHEGLPVVLVEAQAAGLPCLVSEAVSREADLSNSLKFIPIDDPAVWADNMQATAAAKEDRIANCNRWRQHITAAGYDVVQNAQEMKRLYEQYLLKTQARNEHP